MTRFSMKTAGFLLLLGLPLILQGCEPHHSVPEGATMKRALGTSCLWSVAGRLTVEDTIWSQGSLTDRSFADAHVPSPEPGRAPGAVHPLDNVRLEVQRKLRSGTYVRVATVATDRLGAYSVSFNDSCAARRYRILMDFDNDQLSVRRALGLQHRVRILQTEFVDYIGSQNYTWNFQFDQGALYSGYIDLDQWRAAAIYWGAKRLVDKTAASAYPFRKKLIIRYPSTTTRCVDGCAIPDEGVVAVRPSWFDASRSHNSQKTDLLRLMLVFWQLPRHTGTVSLARPNFAGFLVGYTSWMSERMMAQFFGAALENRPFHRAYLRDVAGLHSWDDLVADPIGVANVLRLLQLPEYYRYDFDPTSPSDRRILITPPAEVELRRTCPDPSFSVWELTSGFFPISGVEMTTRDGLERFLERLSARFPDRFGVDVRAHFQSLAEPNPSVVPAPDALCEIAITLPKLPR